jgi:hypothetical protein
LNCVAICITQQAHRCSGELQVPSVRPSVVHAVCAAGAGRRTAVARVRKEEEAGRLESRRTGGGARRHPRTRAGYDRAAFSLNLLACPSRLRISVFPFFLRSSRFSPRKKQWRRRTELGKPRCRDPQQHQCRDHKNTNAYTRKPQCRDPQKHQCLHSKTPMPRPTKTPMPAPKNPNAATHKNTNAYTRKPHCLHTRWGRGPMPTHVSFGNSRV